MPVAAHAPGLPALVAAAPLLWVAIDTLVTGDPLYSLHSTAVLAAELERTKGFTSVLAATWRYLVRIDKLPIVLGGLAGAVLGIWLTPRRARVPLAVLALLLLVYVAEGAAGASVIDRYMMGAAALLLPFCALAIGGWSLLRPGSPLRRVWMAAGAALLVYGAVAAVSVTSPLQRAHHARLPRRLPRRARRRPAQPRGARRTGALPAAVAARQQADPRRPLDPRRRQPARDRRPQRGARRLAKPATPRSRDRIARASVAVYPLGAAVFQEAIVDVGDNPLDQIALPGFRRIYTSRYYAVYGNC